MGMRGLCNEQIWRTELINELVVLFSFKMLTHAKIKTQIPGDGVSFYGYITSRCHAT